MQMFNKRGNMNCQKIRLLLSRYQDNECDEEICSEISTHLQKCQFCQEEYKLLEKIKVELNKLSNIEPETNFTANLMSNIQQKKKIRFSPIPSMIYSFIFILFFIMGILINKDIGPEKEEITISQLLLQGQDLNSIFIQDTTFDLLKNGGNNER
jgi:hypothetical protein